VKSNRPIGPSFELKNYETNPSGFFVSDRPDFKADSVSLHVSREKDGKLRLVYAGWDDAKVVQPDEELRASSQRVEGRILPRRQGKR
jgi:hypothetical protein